MKNLNKMIIAILIIVTLSFNICQANSKIYAKIGSLRIHGNSYSPLLMVYYPGGVFKKEIFFDCGYYVKNNYLIIFEELDNYNNFDKTGTWTYFKADIYHYQDQQMKMIYTVKKSEKSYKSIYCMSDPLYENKKLCNKIGIKFLTHYYKMKQYSTKKDFISMAILYAKSFHIPRPMKNSKWYDKRIVGRWAAIQYNHDITLKLEDYESMTQIIYVFKKIEGKWRIVYHMDISHGRLLRFSDMKKEIPDITLEIAKKLGFRYTDKYH